MPNESVFLPGDIFSGLTRTDVEVAAHYLRSGLMPSARLARVAQALDAAAAYLDDPKPRAHQAGSVGDLSHMLKGSH